MDGRTYEPTLIIQKLITKRIFVVCFSALKKDIRGYVRLLTCNSLIGQLVHLVVGKWMRLRGGLYRYFSLLRVSYYLR